MGLQGRHRVPIETSKHLFFFYLQQVLYMQFRTRVQDNNDFKKRVQESNKATTMCFSSNNSCILVSNANYICCNFIFIQNKF